MFHSALYLPSLNVKACRIARCEVSLLPVGRMLKPERGGMMRFAPLSSVPSGSIIFFSHYLINSTFSVYDYGTKKMCVVIFPTTLKLFLFEDESSEMI